MAKIPSSYPRHAPPCNPTLPEKALQYRFDYPPPLTTDKFLGAFNVTAWLYRDAAGVHNVHLESNTTIEELKRKFGSAETPDAEVGFHSEMLAAQWFLGRLNLQVVQIFSERIPCPKMCAPMLRTYFPGIPWYYYYDRRSWIGSDGNLVKNPAAALKVAYGL
jgi:hypothetical protein